MSLNLEFKILTCNNNILNCNAAGGWRVGKEGGGEKVRLI